jgi:hypothetical protein
MNIEFIQKKPFFIFIIKNFLSDDEYETIYKNFPDESFNKLPFVSGNKKKFESKDDLYKFLNEENNLSIKLINKKFNENFCIQLIKRLKKELLISRTSNLYSLKNFKKFYTILKIPKFFNGKNNNIFQKLFYSNFQHNIEFSHMYKNSFIRPHTDKVSKLLSMMLYFPTKNLQDQKIGTTFYNSNIKNLDNIDYDLFDESKKEFFNSNFKETITFPFKKKNLYCFIKSNLSWHSVKKLDISDNDIRRSININIKI